MTWWCASCSLPDARGQRVVRGADAAWLVDRPPARRSTGASTGAGRGSDSPLRLSNSRVRSRHRDRTARRGIRMPGDPVGGDRVHRGQDFAGRAACKASQKKRRTSWDEGVNMAAIVGAILQAAANAADETLRITRRRSRHENCAIATPRPAHGRRHERRAPNSSSTEARTHNGFTDRAGHRRPAARASTT